MAAATVVFIFKRSGHARTAIGFASLVPGFDDERPELLIGELALAGLAMAPLVITAAGDAQHPTDLSQRKFHREGFHLGIPFCSGGSERMPRDFFRISLCVRRYSFSWRKRWFSTSSSAAVIFLP